MMLQRVQMNFWAIPMPIPTILKQIFNKENYQIGENRLLLEAVDLEAEDGRILSIYDAEIYDKNFRNNAELRLFVMNNKIGQQQKNWFRILIEMDSTKKFIRRLEFSRSEMEVK